MMASPMIPEIVEAKVKKDRRPSCSPLERNLSLGSKNPFSSGVVASNLDRSSRDVYSGEPLHDAIENLSNNG
jgi:hypothetical protein